VHKYEHILVPTHFSTSEPSLHYLTTLNKYLICSDIYVYIYMHSRAAEAASTGTNEARCSAY
jgi:hypothetical protein